MANITKAERERREAVARAEKAEKELAEIRGKVRDKAVEMAREYDWCSDVYVALEEVGIQAVQKVRIAVFSELVVEVPVYTDIEGFEQMSEDEQKNAIIDYLIVKMTADRWADRFFTFGKGVPTVQVLDEEIPNHFGWNIEYLGIED